VRETSRGPQAVLGGGDRREQRAVGQRSLDERLDAALARQDRGAVGRRGAVVGGADDREARDVESRAIGRVADARLGADERRRQVAGERPGESRAIYLLNLPG
jgi:hypothetical protein